MEVDSNIPPELLEKLHALKPALEQQGVVQEHQGSYRLRYREFDAELGCRVHKALPLGEAADSVRVLLQSWRDEKAAQLHATELHRQEALLAQQKQRLHLNLLCELENAGWRRRRSLRDWLNNLYEDPRAAMRFSITRTVPRRKRPGRPRRKLWLV